nr:glycosyltransferase [Aquitalea pelogenes]
MREPLSVVLITKNAAAQLEKTLASVQWADEIVVVDSGSTDETVVIASAYKAKLSTRTGWDSVPRSNLPYRLPAMTGYCVWMQTNGHQQN